jgi:predicted alpha/beta superfamily hydrolase
MIIHNRPHTPMKALLVPLIASILFIGCNSSQIVIGKVDRIESENLDEKRDIWVNLPESAKEKSNSNRKYPVVYLLDGDAHFYSVTGMIRQLSVVNGNTICPEMIVVGIPNTDRFRDLSPTHVDVIFGDSSMARSSGGGEYFLDFLEQELIPHIEKNYPASTYRTFIGHSLGGLTVAHTLLNRPELFQNYVALDPSLWWNDQALVKAADSILSQKNFEQKTLYLGVANTMPEGMEFSKVKEDSSAGTLHIRSMLELLQTMEADEQSKLTLGWKYYKNDDHGSVPLIAEYDAIRFLFSWYSFDGVDQFYSPMSKPEDLLKAITEHYEVVSKHYGYVVSPSEDFVNALGYQFLEAKMLEKSYALFHLNIDNYPNSANVYDSMGDYHLDQSDAEKAAVYFSKALEVGRSPDSKKKLKQLKTEK